MAIKVRAAHRHVLASPLVHYGAITMVFTALHFAFALVSLPSTSLLKHDLPHCATVLFHCSVVLISHTPVIKTRPNAQHSATTGSQFNK